MRLSTSEMYRIGMSNILKQQNSLLEIQSHISSGKRIAQPSDDPIATSKIILIRNQLTQNDQYTHNIATAKSRLEQEESLMNGMTQGLQNIRELYIQMNNDSYDPSSRRMIANEINAQLENLVGISNYQDSTGQYIFSGFQSLSKPYTVDSAGNYLYNGDSGQQFMSITATLQIPISDSGFDTFENVPTGNGTFSISESPSGNTGSAVISPGYVNDWNSYIQDTYTISFSMIGGELNYSVQDSQNNPVSTGVYLEDSSISFNGITVELTGTPDLGDQFILAPSQGKSIFNAIHSVTEAFLNSSNADPAHYHNLINQGLKELDNAIDRINQTRSQIGSRLHSLESAEGINNDFEFQSKSLLSLLEDVDLAEAAVDLTAQTAALQAAQQSFVKIQNLTIFTYL